MFITKLNIEQANERERITFGCDYRPEFYGMGGIRYFEHMTVEKAKELLRLGYIDPDDTQNASPTNQAMIDFCDDGTGMWYLHGYMVSPERIDTRVSFEGIGSDHPLTDKQAADFYRMFREADECDAGDCGAYCWYD